MSIKWMTVVWDQATDVQGTDLLLLLALADYANDEGRCFPSVAKLATRCRRTDRTIQDALTSLVASGWLSREMRPGRSTVYYLQMPNLSTPEVDFTPEDLSGVKRASGVTPEADRTPPPKPTAPTPEAHRTHNHQGTVIEPGGGEPQEGGATRHVADPAFPRWAQANLAARFPESISTNAKRQSWMDAWAALVAQPDTVWDPSLHLTKYLSRCDETRRAPTPAEWQRWFAEDETRAKADRVAATAEQAKIAPPANPYWE